MKIFRVFLLSTIILASVVLMVGCAAQKSPMDAGSPQNPPLPKTESILPLEIGNLWVYTNMVYDTDGNTLYDRYSLELKIPYAFGISGQALTQISWDNYGNSFDEVAYAFDWDQNGHGYLVAHRGANVPQHGVYVIGKFSGTSGFLYDSARLWLAYPASVGYSYILNLDSAGDTTGQSYMEVVSVNEPYYFADSASGQASPLTFVNCYLYKEQYGDTISYYWYNKDWGAVAYQKMYHGRKINTYMLRAFRSESYYYGI
jgi:hypothetical protein